MGMLGRLLGVEPVARELVRHMGTRLAISARRGHGAAARNGPVRVYFEVSADPLMAMGAGSYVGDLITLAGGKNIVRDLGGEYPQISPEFIVAMDPQVIILSHAANPARALEEVRRRPGWGNLSAVREGRVYADLDMDSIMRPGPRIISGAAQLQQRFYPDK
jgi:iron complex transport system substrate-binding protein